jgi:hypothetical protein
MAAGRRLTTGSLVEPLPIALPETFALLCFILIRVRFKYPLASFRTKVKPGAVAAQLSAYRSRIHRQAARRVGQMLLVGMAHRLFMQHLG